MAGVKVSPHILFLILKIVPLRGNKIESLQESYLKIYNKRVKFFLLSTNESEYALFTASSDTVYFILSTDMIRSLDVLDFKYILNLYESAKPHNKIKTKILQDLWILFYSIPYSVLNIFSLLTANRLLIIEKFFLAPLYLFAQKQFVITVFPLLSKSIKVGSFNKVSMIKELDTSVLGPHLFLFHNMLYF